VADAQAEASQAVLAMRAELGRLRSSVQTLEAILDGLELAERAAPASPRRRPERYLRVLVEVYERGGRHGVDAEALAEIGRRHGYDRRGLGGFFTGVRAPLRRVDGRVCLSVHGEQLMDGYLAALGR